MDELVSNGFRFDLDKSTPFPIDLSITDLLDPKTRKRSKSKTIKLKGTQANCSFFINNFSLTVTGEIVGFDATKRTDVIYYKNGIAILPDGVLQLNEATITDGDIEFTVTVYSDSVDVFLILSEIDITDLDWSDYDHTLNRTNVKDSWTTADGTGYRYPLIERGNGRAGTTIWNTTDLIPYVHFAEVMTKILDYAGISFTSTFLSSSRIKKILYGYGGGDYIKNSISPADINQRKIEIDNGDFTKSLTNYGFSQQLWSVTNITIVADGFNMTYDLPTVPISDLNFTETITQDILTQYLDGKITVQRSGNYTVSLAGILDIVLSGGNTFQQFSDIKIGVYKNGTNIWTPSNQNMWLTNTIGTTYEFDFNLANSFLFQSGDEITFRVNLGYAKYTRLQNEANIPVTFDYTTNTPITIDVTSIDVNLTDGGTIVMSKFIPPMKCSDFLIGGMKNFYLTMSEPNIYGVVRFESLADFYQGTNIFDDISTLLDEKKPITIKPTANEFQKKHLYKYKANKDGDNVRYFEKYANDYGDYQLEQGSFYAKGENKIELPWSNIVPYEISTGIQVPRFITIDNNGAVKPNKGAPRLCMWNGLKNGSWTFRNTDDPTDFEVLTTYPCIHHFDDWENPDFDLNFQLVNEVFYPATIVTTVNTYTEYYSQFINEMTSPLGQVVECYVKWNELDVQRRDFSKLIMIDGALFRLNKISDFDSDKVTTTKIELIKVLSASKRRGKLISAVINGSLINGTHVVGGVGSVDPDAPYQTGGLNTVYSNSIKHNG